MLNRIPNVECYGGSKMKGYASTIGFMMANPNGGGSRV